MNNRQMSGKEATLLSIYHYKLSSFLIKLYFYFQNLCYRWPRLLLILSSCLIISLFVLFWSDEENSVVKVYTHESTQQSLLFFDSNKSINLILPNLKLTTTSSLSPTPASLQENLTTYDRYMLTNLNWTCYGVGNMLFRISSLYGIGKRLKRNACIQGACSEEYQIELYSMFPNLQKFPLLRNCWNHDSKEIKFAENGWNYDNVSKLNQYDNEIYLNLQTSYLQSHKFFHWARSEILYMFEFSNGVKEVVDAYAKQMFSDDGSIKFCAHIRQSDFNRVGFPLLPSSEKFTVNGIKYIIETVVSNKTTEISSVLLFSEDIWFANNIAKQLKESNLTDKAFVSQQLNRLENIALAARHCDYFLITSSGSTFGWWMAYLMPDSKQENVYYNSLFFKKGHEWSAKDFREEDFFPPKWNRMILENNETIVEDRSKKAILVK